MISSVLKFALLGLLFVAQSQSSPAELRKLAENSYRHLPGPLVVQYKDSGAFQQFSCHEVGNLENCKGVTYRKMTAPESALGYPSTIGNMLCFCFKDSGKCIMTDPINGNSWEDFVTLPLKEKSEELTDAHYFMDEAVFSTNKGHLYEVRSTGEVKEHPVRWQSPLICGVGDGERDYAITMRSPTVIEIWYIDSERKWETHYVTVSEVFESAGCVAQGNEIYMAGGRHADGSPSDSVYVINTKTWKVKELQGSGKLPTPSDNVKMAIVGNKPAAFGVNSSDGKSKQVFTYDKTTNSWTISTLKLNKNEDLHFLFQV